METFTTAAGAASFAGLIAVFAISVVSRFGGWSKVNILQALAVVLGFAIAKGAGAYWGFSGIYLYGLAAALALSAIAEYARRRQASSVGA